MEEENKSEAKTISLPKKVWELMDKLADKTEISRSSLIQIALFNFYEIKNTNGKMKCKEQFTKKLFLNSISNK
jgi:metal-responsive CopG/Arc/MetJ family transcriptional regulator